MKEFRLGFGEAVGDIEVENHSVMIDQAGDGGEVLGGGRRAGVYEKVVAYQEEVDEGVGILPVVGGLVGGEEGEL